MPFHKPTFAVTLTRDRGVFSELLRASGEGLWADAMEQRASHRDRLLENWVRRFQGPLLSYFRKRAPEGVDPSDLAQDVFVRLAKSADPRRIENPEGYVFRTAANVATDAYRRNTRQKDGLRAFVEENAEDLAVVTPERVLLGVESMQTLVDAIADLNERERTVFVLYHFENVLQKEIAERLGIGLRTVERCLARALSDILKRLNDADDG